MIARGVAETEERLLRNIPAISEAEQRLLLGKRVFIAGCGGLGGWIAEYMARLGVAEITLCDPDVFAQSNINRQLGADMSVIGLSKVTTVKDRLLRIAPNMRVNALDTELCAENAVSLIGGHDIVFDALDGIGARLALENACAAENLPLIHGAVRGWTMQVAVVPPKSGMLGRLYSGMSEPGAGTALSFVPACCAAVQCAQATALLCGKPCALLGKLLTADMLTMEQHTMEL